MMYGENIQTDETWKRIPEGSVGVEIGVWRGDSSEKFLRRASKLYLVDPWSPVAYEDSDEFGDYDQYLQRYSKLVGSSSPADFQKYYDKIYQNVCDRFNENDVIVYRGTSASFFETWFRETPAEKVDWVYLDGSHAYDLVLNDLNDAASILKPNGILLGDDYSDKKPGVKQAVDDYVKSVRGCGFDVRLEVFGPGNKRWPDAQYQIIVGDDNASV